MLGRLVTKQHDQDLDSLYQNYSGRDAEIRRKNAYKRGNETSDYAASKRGKDAYDVHNPMAIAFRRGAAQQARLQNAISGSELEGALKAVDRISDTDKQYSGKRTLPPRDENMNTKNILARDYVKGKRNPYSISNFQDFYPA